MTRRPSSASNLCQEGRPNLESKNNHRRHTSGLRATPPTGRRTPRLLGHKTSSSRPNATYLPTASAIGMFPT